MSVLTHAALFRHRRRSVGSCVVVEFLAAGVLWVALSDALLYSLVADAAVRARLETLKGWMFVAVAAVFIYATIEKHVARLQKSEATMRAIVNSIGDGILLVGKDGRIVDANPAAVKLLGVDDKQSVIGIDAAEFSRRFHWSYPDGTIVPPEKYISQRALHGEPIAPYKALLYPEKGPLRTISSSAAPVRIDHGGTSVVLSVSVMRDITEMEALDRMRDDFFAAAAHSLKTPITVIRSHAQLLARLVGSQGRESVLAIDRNARQVDRLVENLLVLSRLKSGTMRLHPREVELRALAERVAKEMRTASAHHELRGEWQAHPRVFADPERTALALKNLVDWAFSTSRPDTEVTLLLRQLDGRARLGVRYRHWAASEAGATGPAAVVDGVTHYAGLDVGRHVTEELVSAQGGQLRVESTPDETTAWIELSTVEHPGGSHAG